jgi:hypothetical protein
MRTLRFATASALGCCLGAAAGAAPGVTTFSARYEAYWKNINVGSSEIELKHGADPSQYVYVWSIAAHGVFRLIYSNAVVQTSWFGIEEGHTKPHRYEGVQGPDSVTLNFDWQNKRVTGASEKKPVDFALEDGSQDINSVQVEIMLDLEQGDLPKTIHVIDKDQLKEFNYTREGTAKLDTSIGPLDTIVVASQRTGNNRILRMWFAPSLGYMPVQAERTRDGKLEFAIRLKSVKR